MTGTQEFFGAPQHYMERPPNGVTMLVSMIGFALVRVRVSSGEGC